MGENCCQGFSCDCHCDVSITCNEPKQQKEDVLWKARREGRVCWKEITAGEQPTSAFLTPARPSPRHFWFPRAKPTGKKKPDQVLLTKKIISPKIFQGTCPPLLFPKNMLADSPLIWKGERRRLARQRKKKGRKPAKSSLPYISVCSR